MRMREGQKVRRNKNLATGMVACVPSSAGRSPGLSPEYETMNASVDKAPEPLVSACDPLGAGIAIAVKEKIWSGEYIELASLLKQDMSGKGEFEGGLAGATFSLRPSEFGMGFQIQPQTKNRKIVSVEQWTSAFLVFASIYMEKHMEPGRELMKYMDLVRHAARAFGGYGWREYDVQFRLKQARQPGRSWASVDAELWLMLVASNGPRPAVFRQHSGAFGRRSMSPFTAPASAPRGLGARRRGTCFAFNKGNCTQGRNCKYEHKCSRCSAVEHGAKQCNRALPKPGASAGK